MDSKSNKASTVKHTFLEGEVIFEEGDFGDIAYIILEGEVDIVRAGPNGNVRLSTIGQHSIFGEMALLDNRPRSASAIAKTQTICLMVNRDKFDSSMKRADPLITGMLRILASNLRATNEKLIGEKTTVSDLSKDIEIIAKS